ncbi:hypothetical protein CEXT_801381 [Caerostris extrusa]|uniref:Uncharacterized protein n=1 Tax=Caerostris extrusa TaxID=172846 RepID=A0AAV4NQ70_CAEEX|nr:hypothetical protein CEXT_801381 [Caerostris extrusa]
MQGLRISDTLPHPYLRTTPFAFLPQSFLQHFCTAFFTSLRSSRLLRKKKKKTTKIWKRGGRVWIDTFTAFLSPFLCAASK